MRSVDATAGCRVRPRTAVWGRGVYQTARRVPALLVLYVAGCAGIAGPGASRIERAEQHMGTGFRVVAYADDLAPATAAIAAAFARIAELDACLSDWDPNSELSRLRQTAVGEPQPVSEDLWRVLALARDVSAATDGAFDVTVGPAVVLWRRARRQLELPTAARLERARGAIGWDKVRMLERGRRVEFAVSGMRLDLGGIAKGYAAQQALAVLREHGVGRALVDAGGDVVVGDPPPGESGWLVALAPLAPDEPPHEAIRVRNVAVATSGDRYRFVEIDGVRYAHIVDPRTGLGLTGQCTATVVAPDGALADALASAACVLGPDRAVPAVARFAGASVLMRRSADGVARGVTSPGFPVRLDAPGRR